MKLTVDLKARIDGLSYEELLRRWRFAQVGDPLFSGESGGYWLERMRELRAAGVDHAAVSKAVGWETPVALSKPFSPGQLRRRVDEGSTCLPRIIGLSAKKRHGKDTLGRLLAQHGYRRIAFADALYEEVAHRYGVSVATLQHPLTKEMSLEALGGLSPRQALQQHGMEHRAQDAEYWVRRVEQAVDECPGQRWVITDVRLPNEAEWAESHGILVRVTRPGLPPDNDTHISETALDNWPFRYRVTNHENQSESMLEQLLGQLSPQATGPAESA